MKEIEEKLPGVKSMEKTVGAEAAKVQIEADKCSTMKKECEDDLAEAIPLLESALVSQKIIFLFLELKYLTVH